MNSVIGKTKGGNCELCQKPFDVFVLKQPTPHRKRFCSSKCSVRAWQLKKYPKKERVIKLYLCPNCNQEFRPRRSISKFCSKKCFSEDYSRRFTPPKKNCPNCKRDFQPTSAHKRKIFCSNRCFRKFNVKENHPSWKGGIKKEKDRRKSYEYKLWRDAVFKRDYYTCQHCGIKNVNLQADHIKPWCNFPELRYELSNGRTLCVPCHKKTDTYGSKAMKFHSEHCCLLCY